MAGALLGLALVTPTAYAQNNADKKSLMYDAAVANSKADNHVFRAEGFYVKGTGSFYGFLDGYGRKTDNYYTEVYGRRDVLKHAGMQFELNDGKDIPAMFRAGAIGDIPGLPKTVYANVKLLPLHVSGAGIRPELQIGTYVSADFGKGWHIEHWADFNLGNTQAPRVVTEATATKKIKGRWAVVIRAGYKVSTEGFSTRAGVRYQVF